MRHSILHATRRAEAEAGVSLCRRRAWFDEEPPAPPATPPPENGRTDFDSLPADVKQYIKSLRDEAKQHHLDKEQAEKQRLQEETARLEAEKQWEALAQTRAQKLAEVEPKAAEVEEYRAYLQTQLERRLNALAPQWREAVPEYDDPRKVLDWLDRNEVKFRLPALPNLNAGELGDRNANGKPKPQPDAAFMSMGRKMGKNEAQIQSAWEAKLAAEQVK